MINMTSGSLDNTTDIQTLRQQIGKGVFVLVSLVMCFLTTSGNLLVLESFRINKKLRTITNYFLISLACADLMIGIISIPISTFYIMTDRWLLGPIICDLWLSLDYTISNASVANLLLISFDRYFSLTRPIVYRAYRTGKKVRIAIACSWILSAILWTPFILKDKESKKDFECRIQFLKTDRFLTLATAFAAFYLPVTIICIIYYKIWNVTKERHGHFLKNLQFKTSLRHSKIIFSPKKSNKLFSILNQEPITLHLISEGKQDNKLDFNSVTNFSELEVTTDGGGGGSKPQRAASLSATANLIKPDRAVWSLSDETTTTTTSNPTITPISNTNSSIMEEIKQNREVQEDQSGMKKLKRFDHSSSNSHHQFEIESSYYSTLLSLLNENEQSIGDNKNRRSSMLAIIDSSVDSGMKVRTLSSSSTSSQRRVYSFKSPQVSKKLKLDKSQLRELNQISRKKSTGSSKKRENVSFAEELVKQAPIVEEESDPETEIKPADDVDMVDVELKRLNKNATNQRARSQSHVCQSSTLRKTSSQKTTNSNGNYNRRFN